MKSPLRTDADRELPALLEEYRALYELVVFRMSALDRRAPVTAGVFGIAVTSLNALPISSQHLLFLATPLALVWLMRTTVNHARSFEDVLRRVEIIEDEVNQRVGKQLIGFQSTHPSRGKYIGGRTGRESVLAVFGSIVLLLAGVGYQFMVIVNAPFWASIGYWTLLALVVALSARELWKLATYRYVPADSLSK